MNQKPSMLSLLPYLEPNDTKIRLDITSAPADPQESAPDRSVFRVLNESSPLSRLLGAEILTDAGSLVQPVFLLVQKDVYRYSSSELWPLTNLDVEASWQQDHSLYHDEIRLGEASAGRDGRNAFKSLFFCAHRRVFFHPPCPGCAQHLTLCEDDSLLLSQGLSAYSSSLRRYLYCPSCPPAKEGNGFYVPSVDIADSVGVRDGSGLIAAWRYLLAGGLAPPEFPCFNCPERDKCHGPENLSAVRILPFGFYPFHLRVVKAMTIRAADFLPLVSGARMEEVEKRLQEPSDVTLNRSARLSAVAELKRMVGEKDLFLFNGTEKHFLEVLYLKLTLLSEITEMMRSGPTPVDLHSALDSLWISIPPQGSFLPGLWSFKLGSMDIGFTREAALGRPETRQAQILYFLGLVWFHVLLTQSSQPAADVMTALAKILEHDPGTDVNMIDAPLFAAENIFWNPAAHRLNEFPFEWKVMWRKTLELAWRLVTADRTGAPWSFDTFQQDLSAIRKEIKKHLFTEGNTPAIAATGVSDDRAIYQILADIIGKWKTAFDPVQTETPGSKDIEGETVILAGGKAEAPLHATVKITNASQPDLKPEEELEKTVVITGVKTREALAGVTAPVRGETEDEPCETLILSDKTTGNAFVPPAPAPAPLPGAVDEGDMILSETVILRPPQK